MNSIDGHIGLVKDSVDDSVVRGLFEAIDTSARELETLAESVREIERVLSQPAPAEPVDVGAYIQSLLSAYRDRFSATTFSVSTPEAPCLVAVSGL